MRYLPLTNDDRAAMLAAVAATSIDDLFVDVPAEARLDGPIPGLPTMPANWRSNATWRRSRGENRGRRRRPSSSARAPIAIMSRPASIIDHPARRVPDRLYALSARNRAGHIADAVRVPEQVARLLGTDVANASMYDGSTACWEAMAMARRVTQAEQGGALGRRCTPIIAASRETMAQFTGDELVDGDARPSRPSPIRRRCGPDRRGDELRRRAISRYPRPHRRPDRAGRSLPRPRARC
jgi:glycine dehydrogenase subunit 1